MKKYVAINNEGLYYKFSSIGKLPCARYEEFYMAMTTSQNSASTFDSVEDVHLAAMKAHLVDLNYKVDIINVVE